MTTPCFMSSVWAGSPRSTSEKF